MSKRYKVSFEIEGENLADDVTLTRDNLKMMVEELDRKSMSYMGNRSIDTEIINLKIEKVKVSKK
jgi:Fe-S cluster assembly iron-binding protein IscA